LVWDTEVDVLCVGAGVGALATAIAAADAGADVVVATAAAELSQSVWTESSSTDSASWLPAVEDGDTRQYLASLIDGFAGGDPPSVDVVPVRIAVPRDATVRTVATFSGARVLQWGSECLGGLTAALFSSVQGWTVEEMTDSAGRSILVAPVDVGVGPADLGVHRLHRSLVSAVAGRDIDVVSHSPLQRLVFEGGVVVGAIVGRPGDEWAVGARHAVVLAPDSTPVAAEPPTVTDEYRLALVSIPGSRFARVELLGGEEPGEKS